MITLTTEDKQFFEEKPAAIRVRAITDAEKTDLTTNEPYIGMMRTTAGHVMAWPVSESDHTVYEESYHMAITLPAHVAKFLEEEAAEVHLE